MLCTAKTYHEAIDEIHDRYKDRMHGVLLKIVEEAKEAGLEIAHPDDPIADWTDELYSYAIMVGKKGATFPDEAIDVRIELIESVVFDGGREGLNFGLDVTAYGGEIVAGVQPYNFTPDVWARFADEDEIESRMQIVESTVSDIIHEIEVYVDRQ